MKYLIIALAALSLLAACGGPKYSTEQVDEFAKCITKTNTTMYGAFWCPHCARTKKLFGASFKYINYVECDPKGENEQSELCIEKNIERYDTWEFPDGSRYVSEPTFEILSERTGCAMPQVK